ncbi:MAG: DMT family transporter, partial [Alphaproteobacteria bacterium]|nr:DMT family transporter [Alphaproteobacteria bacterium]
ICYYGSARDLQLAEISTIYFAAPVIVMVLAIPMLGERVSKWCWAAVIVGFAGVVISCNPVALGFSWPVALALVGTFLWALSIVLIRGIALNESTMVQMIYANGFYLVATGGALAFTWQTPSPAELLLLLGCGVIGAFGQLAIYDAMRRAPASLLAPFEYTALVWAFILGFVIWGDTPRTEVYVGAGLIVAAGLIVLWSERRAEKPAPTAS